MKITEIKSNPNNPRVIKDDKFKKLCKSIQDFPKMMELRPIIVDADNIVLGGNMRLKALLELGYKEIPDAWVKQADKLTEEEKKQFIVKDNVGFGEWNYEDLANNWNADDLVDWGLDLPIVEETPEATEDNFTVDAERTKTDIIIGDLFTIGEHRLLCGDSTDSDAVAKLMDGKLGDLAHNDPPYGMKKESEGVINDNLNYTDLLEFNRQWIALQFSYLKENGSFYCWGIDEPLMDIYSEIIKPYINLQKATFRNLITWDKGNGQGQNSDNTRSYAIADEKCLFVMCGVQGFNNNADNYFEGWESIRSYLIQEKEKSGLTNEEIKKITSTSHTHYWSKSQWAFPTLKDYDAIKKASINKAFKREYEDIKREYEDIKREYYATRAYFNNTHDNFNNVWHFDRHLKNGDEGGHATPKPIALCERVIMSSCPDNGIVLDFFLGSGSTMVAAHQLKRKCYGIELDPVYCQVIINRMIKLDPSLVITKNGLPYEATQNN